MMRIVITVAALAVCSSAWAADNWNYPANAAELLGGAEMAAGRASTGSVLANLAKVGQGVKFAGLPAASKMAIRYGSVSVGTISVAVNDQPPQEVNVHSSGDLTRGLLV